MDIRWGVQPLLSGSGRQFKVMCSRSGLIYCKNRSTKHKAADIHYAIMLNGLYSRKKVKTI